MYVCICIYIYICMYVYMYIYTHMYTCTHRRFQCKYIPELIMVWLTQAN